MANIEVNRNAWEKLSSDDQNEVLAALKEAGAMTDEDTLIPTDNAPEMAVADTDFMRGVVPATENASCEAACNAAYAAAVSRCNLLPIPAARAICYGAATAAYGLCLKEC